MATRHAIIQSGLDAYVMALNALMSAHRGDGSVSMVCEVRRKYAKIISIAYGSRSSYSYVDLTSGDVVKGNWKGVETAVLHIKRGNVCDGSWLDWHGPYGIGYADGHGEFRRMLDDDAYMVATDAIKQGDGAAAALVLTTAIRERRAANLEVGR